jgi:hypothetical protein
MASSKGNLLGGWAFLIGVILAVVLGLLGSMSATWTFLLVIIGLIVGLLNITEQEVTPFLMSGAVLIIATSLGQTGISSIDVFSNIMDALLAIFVPATIIVAIKNVFSLARN